jgi:hypothetical protein
VLLLLLAATVGCSDLVAPEPRGTSLRIYMGSVPFDEQTIAVGAVLSLRGQVLDSSAKPVTGESVSWTSDNPGVVTVNANGEVVGNAIGTARVIARSRVGEDTARINVAAYVSGSVTCTEDQELAMPVRSVRIFTGPEALRICLGANGSTSDYALVVMNGGKTASSNLQVNLTATRMQGGTGGPGPTATSLQPTPVWGEREVRPDTRFHARIRSEVSRNLEARMRAGVAMPALTGPAGQLSPNEVVSYNIATGGADGCSSPVPRGGRVRAITERAIVVADTLNPANGFTDADYLEFGHFFDQHAWPLVTETFGAPSDIDGNGKVILFFTRAVNELSQNAPSSGGSYVAGFFFNRDLFPTTGRNACAGSNAAEMFYLMVPDPSGQIQGRAFTRMFVRERTPGVVVHEFQHLVNDSRRLHVNGSLIWEETWLNEGLSHIAEELMFFRETGLQPRQNIGTPQLQGVAAQTAFQRFQLDNVDRLASYLRDPEVSSLLGPDQLPTRGAAWSFLRYAADRYTGAEANLWRNLVRDSKMAGLANLQQALMANPVEWIRDWTIALYADDLVVGGVSTPSFEPRYQSPSWNLRSIFAGLGTIVPGRPSQAYPLRVVANPYNTVTNFDVSGGSAAYATLEVAQNSTRRAAIRVTVGPPQNPQFQLPAPERLKVAVVRLR